MQALHKDRLVGNLIVGLLAVFAVLVMTSTVEAQTLDGAASPQDVPKELGGNVAGGNPAGPSGVSREFSPPRLGTVTGDRVNVRTGPTPWVTRSHPRSVSIGEPAVPILMNSSGRKGSLILTASGQILMLSEYMI